MKMTHFISLNIAYIRNFPQLLNTEDWYMYSFCTSPCQGASKPSSETKHKGEDQHMLGTKS